MRVVDEEQYLAERGASFQDIGEPALHRQPGSTPRSRARLSAQQNARDAALLRRRAKLRAEYRAKVEAGELRPPTRVERLLRTAAGHPDNASVQAARRILDAMGVDWKNQAAG